MKIVLASKSPRRLEIFKMFSLDPEVIVSDVDETVESGITPAETVIRISQKKGGQIAKIRPESMVVSADTVVVHDGKILGKPKNEDEAFEMLRTYSGRSHEVFTGYTVFYKGESFSRAVKTVVTFKELSNDEITAYIMTGEPKDKAGAYGAQGRAAAFIEKIEGDFFNVVGFPLSDFYTAVKENFDIRLI